MPSSDDSRSEQGPLQGGYSSEAVPLGQLLKRARERKGLTLEQVANETRIPKRHLEALECDNLSALPNGFYRRAQVRAFARTVSLDQDVALGRLNREAPPALDPIPEVPVEAPHPEPVTAAPEATAAVPVEPAATAAPPILSRAVAAVVVLLVAAVVMARLIGGLGSVADVRTGQQAAALNPEVPSEPPSPAGLAGATGADVPAGSEVPVEPQAPTETRRPAGPETRPEVLRSDVPGATVIAESGSAQIASTQTRSGPSTRNQTARNRASRNQASRNQTSPRAARTTQNAPTARQQPAQTAERTATAAAAQTTEPAQTPAMQSAVAAPPPATAPPVEAPPPVEAMRPVAPPLLSAPPAAADAAKPTPPISTADAKRPEAATAGRAGAAPRTQLVLQTRPGGARVTVNGVVSGTSPTTIRNVPPGRTRIRVVKNGYAPQDLVIRLTEGRPRSLTIRLRKTR